ncbi:oligosaccharide flippase family protein [Alkalihalobacterium alkalinitrilicum]|uniref:oligosaccharide flippase family protein n=1 Tax=Alkalihalobacterium alkalinitrilicum TaxID=427920 RepID=UPI0009951F64|nr:oligosaccharide flippase family protein [Alkalihalobacterium alkalinitrilicum]
MLKKLKGKLAISSTRKNILKLSSGTGIGFIISLVTLPIITRIYGAEIIGIWALFTSMAIIINALSDLGLTNTIMVEDEDDVERNYKIITTISAISSIVISSLVTLFYFLYFNSIDMNIIFFYFTLVIIVFTTQQIQICYTWLNRKNNYNVLMKNPLINNSLNGLLSIVFGFFGFITYGYFIANMIGQVVTLIHMKRNLPRGMFSFNYKDFIEVINVNKKFVVYQTPTNILGTIKSQLPILLIQMFWGTQMVGYYSISIRLLQMPSSLLGSAIGRIFFQTTSSMKREDKPIGQYVYNNIRRIMNIAILPIAMLISLGDIIIIVFLGPEWEVAGNLVRILALYFFFGFIITSTRGLAITLDRQNYTMIFTLVQLFISAVSLSMGKFIFDNIYHSFVLMAILFILVTIIFFCTLFKVMKISWKKYVRNVLFNLILLLIIATILRVSLKVMGIIDLIYKY